MSKFVRLVEKTPTWPIIEWIGFFVKGKHFSVMYVKREGQQWIPNSLCKLSLREVQHSYKVANTFRTEKELEEFLFIDML